MSDTYTSVIPIDPLAVPDPSRREAVAALLRDLRPEADAIEIEVSDAPIFFDCGGNFGSVACPLCAADLEAWWGDAMDAWADGDRRDLATTTPCCAKTVSLNDLVYDFPQGFARVGITVKSFGEPPTPAEQARVEAALGGPVRVIHQHI
jgi:hypothetical protein